MKKIRLSDVVQKALRKDGAEVSTVVVETAPKQTVGLFHLKLRHLNDFIRYFVEGYSRPAEDYIGEYVKLRQLDAEEKEVLKFYDLLHRNFNLIYAALEQHPGCKDKVMGALCGTEKEGRTLEDLRKLHDSPSYKTQWENIIMIFEEFCEMERTGKEPLGKIKKDIMDGIEVMLKFPSRVYLSEGKQDIIFCSEYKNKTFVLSLVTGRGNPGEANLITGLKTPASKWKPSGFNQVYTEPKDE